MADNTFFQILSCAGTLLLMLQCSFAFTLEDLASASRRSHHMAYIIGGGDADKALWTWQAALKFLDPFSQTYSPVCGAALISPQWLLTAAHCIDATYGASRTDPSKYKVVLGAYDLNNPTGSEVIADADKFITHASFYLDFNAGYPNDIGLIRLSEPVDLTKHGLQAIALPDTSTDFSAASCYITGWGRTSASESSATFTGTLQQGDATIMDTSACRTEMAAAGANGILDTHTCVGGEGQATACEGDSGSPLSCNVNGAWTLAGIYSWYLKCEGLPSVYTQVPSYLDWISKHMAE